LSVSSLHNERAAPVRTRSKAKPKLMTNFIRIPRSTAPL
jgi:hypothetical protein